jgi:hypothetical protein
MRYSTRMMMMTTARIAEHRVLDRALLAKAMTMRTARVRRTPRSVRKGPGMGREQRMGRGKGRGMGRETVKGEVLLNEIQGEMISLVPLL